MELLKSFDCIRREVDQSGVMSSLDEFNRTAVEILTADTEEQRGHPK
jgi:hypothetical protein